MADPTLEDFAKYYEGLICRWDYAPLTGKVDYYNHADGVMVSGFEMPQWISMRCTMCQYQWSLRKLDILRLHTQRYKDDVEAMRRENEEYGSSSDL